MENGYEFLTEKEEMWAKMLVEVLKNNDIPCITMPVYGAVITIKTAVHEILQVYVPADKMQEATDLVQQLFSEDSVVE